MSTRVNLLKADTYYRIELIRDREQKEGPTTICLSEDALYHLNHRGSVQPVGDLPRVLEDIATPGELEELIAGEVSRLAQEVWEVSGKGMREDEDRRAAVKHVDALLDLGWTCDGGVLVPPDAGQGAQADATEANVEADMQAAEGSGEDEWEEAIG